MASQQLAEGSSIAGTGSPHEDLLLLVDQKRQPCIR
jgi:hypothetical protein